MAFIGSSSNSSDSGFEVHEVIFAESLGVNLQEEFALELLEVASKALYVLPEGWEVGLAESELGTIPFFYDTNSDQSHWVHPYAQDLKMLIEEKRLELLCGEDVFKEEDDEDDDGDFFVDTEDASNVRVNTDVSEIDALPPRIKPSFDELRIVSEENEEMKLASKDPPETTHIEASTDRIETVSSNEKNIIPEPSIDLKKQDDDIKKQQKNVDNAEETSQLIVEIINPDIASTVTDIVHEPKLESTQSEISIVEETQVSERSNIDQIDEVGLVETMEMTDDSSDASIESVAKENPSIFVSPSKELPKSFLLPETNLPVEAISNEKEFAEDRNDERYVLDQIRIENKDTNEQKEIGEVISVSKVVDITEQLSAADNETEVVIPDNQTVRSSMQEDAVERIQESNKGHNNSVDLSVEGAAINIEASDSVSLIAYTPLNSLEGEVSLADIEDASSLASNSSTVLVVGVSNDVVPTSITSEKENRSSPMQLENKDMTPPKGIPLPADPFADFFAIDPSFHQFIDNLEKKQKQKKKKLLTKAGRSPIKSSISASADDNNNESLDLDEIIQKRRQAERAQEMEKERIQKEKEEKEEEIRHLKQKVMEEEEANQALLLQKEKKAAEKAQNEKAEQAATEAKENVEQEKNAADEAEEWKEKETVEIICVPTVPAHSPPFSKTCSMDLGNTTISLFDNLVAQESIPDNDDDAVNHHLVHFHHSLSFTQKLEVIQTPVTPLDKSIDVMDHFRNIYSAPTADQQHHHIIHHRPHAQEMRTPDISPTKKGKFLDTTKLVTKDTSKRNKKKHQTITNNDPSSSSSPTITNNLLSSTSAPKLKSHASSVDGWVNLAAYANYKEAERAVALFEALAPTKSIAGQSFPSHSKFLPPVKGWKTNYSSVDESYASMTSPLKKKSLLLSNAPITKESILLSTQQELPQVRIARDLGRMQWIVECNDVNMKKVFERRIARRLHQGQGAEKLLAHLSPVKQQALGLGEEDTEDALHGTRKSKRHNMGNISPLKHIGEKFTAPFVPQALISSKNTKHVSGQMHVHYALPRVSYDEQQKTKLFRSNNNNNNIATLNEGAKTHRGPLTFRAVATLNASPERKPRPSSTHL